ncbi:carboxymuconolactone decarboxylase family protein [uncultured Arthrobacter sp.]|uniref:carboxymuconolactone decarboxylase family protein n=1 Tax=uncultured Arthrobacter sp. TaxID=114050 RepID=UPI0025D1E494|nr:carboxymuconolactone decarboxylase family protein [uncultured Arthrobacter sp.]
MVGLSTAAPGPAQLDTDARDWWSLGSRPQRLGFLVIGSIRYTDATDRQRELLDRGKRAARMLPNVYRVMANSPALLDTYLTGYEQFRAESGFDPVEQEVVFLTISAENACEYCMAAHSLVADTVARVPHAVTEAVRGGTPIPDPRLEALSTFTRQLLLERGRPTEDQVAAFRAAGYTDQHALHLVLALAVKTLSNYTNHLADTPLDTVFRAREWKAFTIATRTFQALTHRRRSGSTR